MEKFTNTGKTGDKFTDAEITELLSGAFRAESIGGWERIRIAGHPFQIGFQHGYLLAPEIVSALNSNKFWAYWLTAQTFDFFASHAMSIYVDDEKNKKRLIPDEYLEELQGIAAGVQAAGYDTTVSEIVAYNCFVDLVYNAFGSLQKDIKPATAVARPRLFTGHRCSAFVATGDATSHGQVVMAHNTWDAFLQGQHFNCVIDLTPSSGNRIVMQASPGYIASMTDFAVTSAGLMITETTIDGHHGFDMDKPPAACTARKACQYGNSIDQWWEIMCDGNNCAYANSWLLADCNSGEIARGELGLKFQALERTHNGVFYGENLASNMEIRNLETSDPDGWSDISGSGARRVRWKRLLKKRHGHITSETARQDIGDHFDEYLQVDQPGSRTLCGHLDADSGLQSSVHGHVPFYPWGALDAKVADSNSAKAMYFDGRWGRACGEPFDAAEFIHRHPQFDWLEGHLIDRPHQDWQKLQIPDSQ